MRKVVLCVAIALCAVVVNRSVIEASIVVPPQDHFWLVSYDGSNPPGLLTIDKTGSIVSETVMPTSLTTPFGSLWKVFVYLYLADNRIMPPPYTCTGNHPDEAFCCAPGESIRMDEALFRSCGIFFDPVRLGIAPKDWKRYWIQTAKLSFPWLTDLKQLQPAIEVPVEELLAALYQVNDLGMATRKTQTVLTNVLIEGTGKGVIRYLGNTVKIKTFTWEHPQDDTAFIGGFAGWLQDGSTIWAFGSGTSYQVLTAWSKAIAPYVEREPVDGIDISVRVRFFDKYPIKRLIALLTQQEVHSGPLNGTFQILFENGNTLEFRTYNTQVYCETQDNRPVIFGVFDLSDYVARVIDREITTEPPEAAKAFAVAIRTYLLQNARQEDGGWYIPDSTHFQRVSIHAPTEEAKRLSAWTEGLILAGVPALRYGFASDDTEHSTPNRMSWYDARQLALEGYYFDEILHAAYPTGKLSSMRLKGYQECERLPRIEAWLRTQANSWQHELMIIPGYEPPENVTVCRLQSGSPYSDDRKNRIFIRALQSFEDQITLAHEYLHLAFKHHPRGRDERFIEETARELTCTWTQ